MKILIDGDSCRVLYTTEKIASKHNIPCHIYCNITTNITSNYSNIHVVDCSKDAADFAITNTCDENDIVITNDSGLAAMILAKKGKVLNANGIQYTNNNILKFLNRRYVNSTIRHQTNRQQVKGRLYNIEKSIDYKKSLTSLIEKTRKESITA